MGIAVIHTYIDWLMQVPKMLGALHRDWAPEAFLVSFKLETDDNILISKVTTLPLDSLSECMQHCFQASHDEAPNGHCLHPMCEAL